MPGDLRLRCAQNLYEVADAEFLLPHQIEQPESCCVTESPKEPWQVELFGPGHALYICVDEYVFKGYIHLDEYVEGETWQRF